MGRDLVRHLERQGYELLREGGNHYVYVNRKKQKTSTVHREINEHLSKKICLDLEIQEP